MRIVERLNALRPWQLAIALGAAMFVWLGYLPTLDPTNLDWIVFDDLFAYVMGWEQFRNAPLVQYPITLNAQYGLEWSSTIVFSDSIPLAAIPLRLASPILPVPFQYLGWWTLASLILQAYFGARLVELRARNAAEIALGAAFFVTAPALLTRIGIHVALASHWLVLCALWLYLTSRTVRPVAWTALLVAALSVHAYLFVMVGAVFGAHVLRCAVVRSLGLRDGAVVAGGLVLVAGWMHALGYFAIGGTGMGGGISRFDLLSFVAGGAFTTLLPDIAINWDSNAFLGTGLLVLLVAVVGVASYRRLRGVRLPDNGIDSQRRPLWPLVAAVALLGVFAITTTVMVANEPVLQLPTPELLQSAYQTFRGMARMIWPAYYLVVLGTVWLALRLTTQRTGWIVLALALVTQLVDIGAGVAFKQRQRDRPSLVEPLADPIWNELPAHYRNLVSVPAYHGQAHRETFAWYAAHRDLGTNIGLFSRTDPAVRKAGARAHLESVLHAAYEPATAYYFPDAALWSLARLAMTERDVAMIADGHHLVLPGARAWTARIDPLPAIAPPRIGEWIPFGGDSAARGLLTEGWSWQESWGLWSADPQPSMVLPVPPNERLRVAIRWIGAVPPGQPQIVRVRIDGQPFGVRFDDAAERRDTFDVISERHYLDVQLDVQHPVTSNDQRLLGVGLVAVRIDRR